MKIWRCAGSLAASLALAASLGTGARAECAWRLFPTVDPVPSGNQLNGIGGTGADDVWESGAAYQTTRSKGYVLHWDGHAWMTLDEADPSGDGGQFSGVASLGRSDVWAIGQAYGAPNYANRSAIAEHWDGANFTSAPLPPVGQAETFLYGVAGVAPDDVWAAGGSLAPSAPQQPYVVHWNGNAWSQSAVPAVPGVNNNLDAVAATGPNDVWTVGGTRASTNAPFRTLAEHWNGTAWSVVPTPNANARSNVFNAVVAIAPNDAWAIGDYDNGKAFTPLTEHWDGRAWRLVPAPDSGAHTTFVFGATAASSNEVFAAGEIVRRPNDVATYLLRWNGRAWSVVPTPNVPHRPVTLLNAVRALPDGSVWAAGGDANAKIVVHAVTEVRSCAKESAPERR